MKANVVNLENKSVGEISLSEEVFGLPVRDDILHRVVNWQLAKRQAGTHHTKGRGEIRGGKKKPFKQKGTGNARQGSTVGPHMVGGGIAMGPKSRSHEIGLPKKIRQLGLKTALSSKQGSGKLIILKDIEVKDSKTSSLVKKLSGLGIQSALIIGGAEINPNFKKSAANIMNVDVLPVQGANVYDILRRENLVLTEEAVKKLEERLA